MCEADKKVVCHGTGGNKVFEPYGNGLCLGGTDDDGDAMRPFFFGQHEGVCPVLYLAVGNA